MTDKKDDEILNNLYAQQMLLQVKMRERKKELGKQEGLIFDSIDQLVCDKHQGAHFKVIGQISGSMNFVTRKQLDIYVCETCKPNDNLPDLDFLNMMDISKAYDCTVCGIVKGEIQVVPYSTPREAWISLAGREGNHYHCKVCGDQLGHHYWKFS